MPTWEDEPRSLAVRHPDRIVVSEENSFVVSVFSGGSEPVYRATVCLCQSDGIYEVTNTDEAGTASFLLTPEEAGPMSVTVTKTGYIPSRSICIVGPDVSPVKRAESRIQGAKGKGDGRMRVPDRPEILSAVPEPSRGIVRIRIGLPERAHVHLSLVDAAGRTRSVLISGSLERGVRTLEWRNDGPSLGSGIYWLVLRTERGNHTRKVLWADERRVLR
jgi:hypothetical protein